MPPRVRPPQSRNTAHQRSKVAKSLQEVYEDSCRENNVHPNSVVYRLLPDKPGTPLIQDSLNLSRNYVGDKGLVPVLAVVQRTPQLKRLNLSENGLRNKAIEHLCAVATRHSSLTSLDLSDNYISEGAAASLTTLLHDNPRITEVVLVNTKIDTEARLKLKDMAAANQQAQAAAQASSAIGNQQPQQ